MKKVLSIALALVMVLSTMIMLVPTASAATTTTSGVTTGVGGKVYYEQDFDDIDPTLVDKDLAAALGWSAPKSGSTIMIENGKLRAVSQYTPSGVYPPTANSWSGGYNTVIVSDPDIKQNSIVLEYKFTYNRRAAGEANDLVVTTKDGTKKTVKADGQGTYQFGSFNYLGVPNQESAVGSSTSVSADNMLLRINLDGAGQATPFKAFDQVGTHQSWWKGAAIDRVNTLPEGDTCILEYHNNPVRTTETEAQRTSTIMNREYSVKVVIEPYAHRMYAFVDDILYQTFNSNGYSGGNYGKYDWERLITDTIGLWIKPGVDATFDDIKISEYVPALTISEVMVNGTAVMNAENKITNTDGKYQWVELTNVSDVSVNVYDYALNITNNWVGTDKIGDEAYKNESAWTRAGSGSTLGYFTPGAKTIGEYTFDSPAYADGKLAPGESAIVLIPDVPVAGKADVSDEAFKAYLTGLGMPATTKLFVCDNTSNNPFVIATRDNEWSSIAIVKAINTSTDGGYTPVAPCAGQSNEYSPAWAECMVSLSAKGNTSGTNWFGMSARGNASFTNGMIGAKFSLKTDSSFEISYSGWMSGSETANTKLGFQKYNANAERTGIDGTKVTTTPGYVPVDCRRVADVEIVALDGTSTLQATPVHTEASFTVDTPLKKGFDTQVWVNGVLKVEAAEAEKTTITLTAAEVTNAADLKIEVKQYSPDPAIIGVQKSAANEDGTYTIRILAGVNDVKSYDYVGFKVEMAWEDGMSEASFEYECEYAYAAVTAYENGATNKIYAADEGFDHFYAIHINNVPSLEEIYDLQLNVTATYSIDGEAAENIRQGAAAFDLSAPVEE